MPSSRGCPVPEIPSDSALAAAAAAPDPAHATWRRHLDDVADRLGVEPTRLLIGAGAAIVVALIVLVVIGRGASGAPTAAGSALGGTGRVAVLPATATTTTAGGDAWVDVVGAVVHPGVYRLPAGSRAVDAVALA